MASWLLLAGLFFVVCLTALGVLYIRLQGLKIAVTRAEVVLSEYEFYQASQAKLDAASEKVRSVLDDSTANVRESHQLIADKGFEYLAKWPAAKRHLPTIKRIHDMGSDVGYAIYSLSKKIPTKKSK